ncbi:MAG: hypothetical protein HBSAPP03_09460 [Phycisphaerae bacterium]|nr:MAG: hypothetical protein HBSAPP03_09460 [Phycisphaerae bacterium]
MPESQMIINYVPGEECRVAIVEDGKLEELHVERHAQASRVGNIYAGVVVNVEPSIQAAFVDFGVGENGFLHVTDLHPRYFPGEDGDATERVGFKTPRRERPPIQQALRRGDEVIVQVLKEGVGTKGPAVTSYLSIPGRFLVMMPGMDKVGVSRKVEDEDERRKMREILDQLELPEGFGFILRTAGMDRTKAELKRDLAYLLRLWKDMEKREATGPKGKPRLLYSESDLLVRALRDILTAEVNEVIVDHEAALQRAARFMKIVSPRGATKLLHFAATTPIFHAFGIEKQIALIHAREVPLPSGGRLVIDQTEALVAIDVNSGKSRESRDAESNAYQTNLEAVDEICRQLRLRDMGGIVINDLIDMRHASHRKDIENRFKERLKRDRAKSTITGISEFGILEMTRQRMRPSHESVHFTDCPTCRGRGMLQKPDSVAADALRELAAILDVERVTKVEMVVAPRVAGELLSTKRATLGRIERSFGKHVDVRVSETVPVDRVSFYAYDAQAADIDLTQLPAPKRPKDLQAWEVTTPGDWAADEIAEPAAEPDPTPQTEEHPIEFDADESLTPVGTVTPALLEPPGDRRGRRRRRGGRDRNRGGEGPPARQPQAPQRPTDTPPVQEPPTPSAPRADQPISGDDQSQRQEGGGRRRRRRRRGRGGGGGGQNGQAVPQPQPPAREGRDVSPDTGGEWGDLPPAQIESPGHTPSDDSPAPLATSTPDESPDADTRPEDSSSIENGALPADPSGQPRGPEGEQGTGRRRRRRRRRGRGGGGGGGGGEGPALGNSPKPQGHPHGQPRGYQGPHQRPNNPPPPKTTTPPAPAPTPIVPKARTLYGSTRRKLSPAELNKRPKPE